MEARYQLRQCPAVPSIPSERLRAPDEQYRLTRVGVKSSRADESTSGGLRRAGRPLLPPLVPQRDEDGSDDDNGGSDDDDETLAVRSALEAVSENEDLVATLLPVGDGLLAAVKR